MQQSFNCMRDKAINPEHDKRRSTPRQGLVSERLKQYKDNIAMQDNETKIEGSPLVKRYNRTHFHSQPTTPTKQINEVKRRLRNPSNTSTNSDISSISDRSDFLKSPISSTDTSEARTSPVSERPQTCNSTSSQDSDGSTALDSPVKSQVTSIVIKTRSPAKTVTTSYVVKRNDKNKIRHHSEHILIPDSRDLVKPKSQTPEPMIEHSSISSGSTSPTNSAASSSPIPSLTEARTSTPTEKPPSPQPPVVKPKPKLRPKPEESISEPQPATTKSSIEPVVIISEENLPVPEEPVTPQQTSTPGAKIEEPITPDDLPPSPTDITPTSPTPPQSYSPTPPQSDSPTPPPPPPPRTTAKLGSDKAAPSEEKSISSYIQLNTLSDRIFKKSLRRGLEFTLLVVGKYNSLY